MAAYNLGFITDDHLFGHVLSTVKKYRFHIDLKSFNANLIDPIKFTFDSIVYRRSIEELIDLEVQRQIDKSNGNTIGDFHQHIFKFIGHEWKIPSKGFDVINEKKNIFCEIKNKHNTMNSASSQKTYMKMQSKILENDLAVCYLVEVIAKSSQDKKWVVSIDGVQMSHSKIRRISIDKFYELVTGDQYAFKKLCEVLPRVIKDAAATLNAENMENSIFKELKDLSPNILNSLYLLSFKKYEGFDSLNVSNQC